MLKPGLKPLAGFRKSEQIVQNFSSLEFRLQAVFGDDYGSRLERVSSFAEKRKNRLTTTATTTDKRYSGLVPDAPPVTGH